MKRTYIGVLLVLASAAGYALMPIFAKFAYASGVSVNTLLFIRFILGAVVFFAYAFLRLKRINISVKQLAVLFILGGICYTLQSTFYFSSVKHIPISLAVLLLYTYPIFVAVISAVVNRERITSRTGMAIGIAFARLILMVGDFYSSTIEYIGVFFALGASIVYSFYIVLSGRMVKQLPSEVSGSFITLFTALSLFVTGLATGGLKFDFAADAWFSIAGLVVFSTVLAILTLFKGMEIMGPTKASVISMTEPIFTIVFSLIVFHEKFGIFQAIGGIGVIAGSVLIILSQREAE